jgi:uncharacterized protein YbjT (DUF2867 family)
MTIPDLSLDIERSDKVARSASSATDEAGTILVLGATGTVGREVVYRLRAAGERPLALHHAARSGPSPDDRPDQVSADLDRPATVDAALDGVDRLFLLTRQTSRQLAQEQAVIAAAARAGVGRVVKLSVFQADDRSPLQIARQHGRAERALQDSGLHHTVLRPVFFMQNLFAMVREGRVATAARDGRVAMIDARNIADAAVAALTSVPAEGRIYTLTGSEAISFDTVADVLGQRTGRSVRHVRVPAEVVSERLCAAGAEAWFAADMAALHGMLADGYEDVVTSDLSALTGTPAITLARFAADFAARFTAPSANRRSQK